MTSGFQSVAQFALPVALAVATIHALFPSRKTLAVTAVTLIAAAVVCVYGLVEVKRGQATLAAARSPEEQLKLLREQRGAGGTLGGQRVQFALGVLGVSIVPLFIGEVRRSKRERARLL